MVKIAELPTFDAADYLDSEEAITAYLNAILEENDDALLASALGDIAKARGMTQIAKDAGIGRESLYKALRGGASPQRKSAPLPTGRLSRCDGRTLTVLGQQWGYGGPSSISASWVGRQGSGRGGTRPSMARASGV